MFDDVPTELSDLRMTADQWKEVAERFWVQNSLLKAVRQKVTSITVDSHELDQRPEESPWKGDSLQMCTINTSTASKNGFAVSTTHFVDARLTLAVVLGATELQVDRMDHLLTNAHEAIGHPLLMLGVSAELLLELLADPINNMRDKCVQVTRKFQEMWLDNNNEGVDYAMDVETIRSETSHLDEEVRTSKQSLQNALEFFCPNYQDTAIMKVENGATEMTKLERFVKTKIRMRFQDIFLELDSLMTLTRISVQEMSSMSATVL